MDFKDISYIIAIYEHKSISQAARALYISQPALSQQLHKIEQTLGKQLFQRSGHVLTPTPACRIIVEKGRKLLTERDMMMYSLHHLQDCPEEKISFGMSPFYARHLLPGILQSMRKNHPQYVLEFVDRGPSMRLEQSVIEGELDCCLLPMHPANPDIEYLPVGMEEIYLAVPREHPLTKLHSDGTIDIANTRDEPYIMHRDIDKIAHLQKQLFDAAGFTPRAVHTTSGWDIIVSFVDGGIGLGLITELIISDYRPENTPCIYRIRNMDMSRLFALGYRRGRIPSPAITSLLETARQEFSLHKYSPKSEQKI